MSRWIIEGLRIGKQTTRYPARAETAPGVSPGLPAGLVSSGAIGQAAVEVCPTAAWDSGEQSGLPRFDVGRCVHCFRCHRNGDSSVEWSPGYEWARPAPGKTAADVALPAAFAHSIHLRVVDAGACGACLHEMALLGKPHYNMHKLGFFVTPSPRKADVLMVAGPVTDHMRLPLQEAFDSMPAPKRVIAVGACALSGGVFGPSFASGGGVAEAVPVDVVVPGCPPPPLALLHALLLVADRVSEAGTPEASGGPQAGRAGGERKGGRG